ncbi:hypothetical protein CDD82_1880 [Ophiocordyceps australis]|uniref:Histone H1 n=1 Tax=Ophiocordyceps australis TaxID=1399860 RepID=A0A2C5YQ98_9HYPO|nr:hypothetical protein CDD82_1880 [Ophiocordyceps australis]
MAPKKTEGAVSKAKPGSTHASYQDMIIDAIVNLKDRNGSSRQSLKKYVKANNQLNVSSDNMFDSLFNKALKSGVEKGVFAQPKGPSGGTKLAKKKAEPKKPAVKKDVAVKKPAPKTAAKPAVKKTTPSKKSSVPAKTEKKATSTSAASTTTASKKATTPKKASSKKSTTTASKPEKPETILTKTKSGRVTKTQKPVASKAASKKASTSTKKSSAPASAKA